MVGEDEVEEEGGGVNQHAANTASASDKAEGPNAPAVYFPSRTYGYRTSSPRIHRTLVGTLLSAMQFDNLLHISLFLQN